MAKKGSSKPMGLTPAVAVIELGTAEAVVTTGTAEGTMSPPSEQRKPEISPEDMAYLEARAGRILPQLIQAFKEQVGRERYGAVPHEQLLKRDAEGHIAREEFEAAIGRYEAEYGEFSVANFLTREAHSYYMQKRLFSELPYREVERVTGKKFGVTIADLEAALEASKAQRKENFVRWSSEVDLKDDGQVVVCSRRRCGREFQPQSRLRLRDGKPVINRHTNQPERNGAFLVIEEEAGKPVKLAYDPDCQRALRDEARAAEDIDALRGLIFETSADADARIERQMGAIDRSSYDRSIFDKVRRPKQEGGRAFRGFGGKKGFTNGPQQRSGRDQRRGGSGDDRWVGRGRDE